LLHETAPTEIYTLSLHDALPICDRGEEHLQERRKRRVRDVIQELPVSGRLGRVELVLIRYSNHELVDERHAEPGHLGPGAARLRSEEHTSELQSRFDLVCRLLLE